MFDLSNIVDLPLIWAALIATAVFLYVLLDGFDLGIGILFPFAPSNKCRDRMMNSVIPFWDGNETWLVLGGGGLFAAFPVAYSILFTAFYIPIILMLLGLILRGVAFEFRFKAHKSRKLWDIVFHIGSLVATFFQGVVLGAFVDGVEVSNMMFSGDSFAWATSFSFSTGFALIFGYSLLGSTWLVLKTDDITQSWARKAAFYSLCGVMIMITFVAIRMLFVSPEIYDLWFNPPHIYYMMLIPLVCTVFCYIIMRDLRYHPLRHDMLNKSSSSKGNSLLQGHRELRPFILTVGIFFACYTSLCLSLYPWMIPFEVDIWEAAAYGPSLSLMLVGVIPLLPIILAYTGYSYYIFRGKSSDKKMY